MTLPSPDGLQAAYTASALVAIWVGWFIIIRPRWRRFWNRVNGVIDTLNGREEFVDQATGRTVAEIKPLGSRIGAIEQTLATVADQQVLLENHENRITALENTHVKDIVTAAERAATAAASTEMLRLIRERDTTTGQATESAGEIGD
jgi:hypothetical protein